jgi:hypothetical protein
VALSVDAPQASHVSPSWKTFAFSPLGVVGAVVSPVDDSRSVIARLSKGVCDAFGVELHCYPVYRAAAPGYETWTAVCIDEWMVQVMS